MLNEIIIGVSMKLNATFGEQYKIYQNDVEQGLQQPCFYLAVLNPTITPLTGQRYMSRNPLDVQYIPSDDAKKSELYTVGWALMDALEYINLPDGTLLRGTSRNIEEVDGHLHCFVTYSLPLCKRVEETAMETLNVAVGTEKG